MEYTRTCSREMTSQGGAIILDSFDLIFSNGMKVMKGKLVSFLSSLKGDNSYSKQSRPILFTCTAQS